MNRTQKLCLGLQIGYYLNMRCNNCCLYENESLIHISGWIALL